MGRTLTRAFNIPGKLILRIKLMIGSFTTREHSFENSRILACVCFLVFHPWRTVVINKMVMLSIYISFYTLKH